MEQRFEEYNIEPNVTLEENFELAVADLPFSYWSYDEKNAKIPQESDDIKVWWDYLCQKQGFKEAEHKSTHYLSYYIQSAKELGNYACDMSILPGATITDYTDANYRLLLPKELWGKLPYSDELYNFVVDYFTNNDPQHIFIYGGRDPWYSVGVTRWLDTSTKQNTAVYVYQEGNHQTEIKSFGATEYNEIMSKLKKWLDIEGEETPAVKKGAPKMPPRRPHVM